MLVPNCSLQLDSVSQYVQQDVDSLNICESDTGERDEWMYLTELNLNATSNNNHPDLTKEYWQIDRSNYRKSEICLIGLIHRKVFSQRRLTAMQT